MVERIRVMIVDDYTLFRQGLRKAMQRYDEIEMVGEAGDGLEAIARIEKASPDVVLMDIQMPRMDGIDCTRLIRQDYPGVNVIALSMHEEAEYILKAVDAGASGYIQKDISVERLVAAIKQTQRGNRPLVHLGAGSEALLSAARSKLKRGKLTSQEMRVLRLMAEGKTNKQIAHELSISAETVKGYVRNIFQKLNAFDRAHAVAVAFREGSVT